MKKTETELTEIELTIGQKLSLIQQEFKAKKSRYNSFGKYNFRSAEDILEALKPFNEKYKVFFTVNETLINANPPIIQSIATMFDAGGGQIDATAIVGIDLLQKGMQVPQQYGTASSYAKKYSLGNLLLIDDTQDADSTKVIREEKINGPVESGVQIKKIKLEVDTPIFNQALEYLSSGGTIDIIKKKYDISEEVLKLLIK